MMLKLWFMRLRAAFARFGHGQPKPHAYCLFACVFKIYRTITYENARLRLNERFALPDRVIPLLDNSFSTCPVLL